MLAALLKMRFFYDFRMDTIYYFIRVIIFQIGSFEIPIFPVVGEL